MVFGLAWVLDNLMWDLAAWKAKQVFRNAFASFFQGSEWNASNLDELQKSG